MAGAPAAGERTPLTPAADEIAVIVLPPGAVVDVVTTGGIVTVTGDDAHGPSHGPVVGLVPGDPGSVGWGETRAFVTNNLRLGAGKHRLDRDAWSEAEQLVRAGRHSYLRLTAVEYYGRARRTAVGVRTADPDPAG